MSGKTKCVIKDYNTTMFVIAKTGDRVSFSAHLRTNPVVQEGFKSNGATFRQNIRYTAYFSAIEKFSILPEKADALSLLSESLQNILTNNLGQKYGNLAYSMISGDARDLYSDQVHYFSVSGLAHVLSVSGLHIGFLTAILFFIFKKLKTNRFVSFAIIVLVLFLYALFANFSPSVIRAGIMCIVGLAANLLMRQKDNLSTLTFTMCLILLFKPMFLFEAGFVLSVVAVFSLILFTKPLTVFFAKIKIPRFLSSALSASISAQIGIIPGIIYFFGSFQLYSVVVNSLVMPLLGLSFILVFVLLFLTFIMPFFALALKFGGILIALVDSIAEFVSLLPFASIHVTAGWYVFLSYIPMFLISPFCSLFKRKPNFCKLSTDTECAKSPKINTQKKVISRNGGIFWGAVFRFANLLVVVALCFSSMLFSYDFKDKSYLYPVYEYSGVTSVVIHENKTYIVGDFLEFNSVNNVLNSLKLNKIEAVYLFNLNEKVALNLIKLDRIYDIKVILCPDSADLSGFSSIADAKIKNFYLFSEFMEFSESFYVTYFDGKAISYSLVTPKTEVLFLSHRTQYTKVYDFVLNRSGIIRCLSFLGFYEDRFFITNLQPFVELDKPLNYHLCTLIEPDWIFDILNGVIYS